MRRTREQEAARDAAVNINPSHCSPGIIPLYDLHNVTSLASTNLATRVTAALRGTQKIYDSTTYGECSKLAATWTGNVDAEQSRPAKFIGHSSSYPRRVCQLLLGEDGAFTLSAVRGKFLFRWTRVGVCRISC